MYWEWDIVKEIGNGSWTVYKKDPDCTDSSVCNKIEKCGSSSIYDDKIEGNDGWTKCVQYPCLTDPANPLVCQTNDAGAIIIDQENVRQNGWAYATRRYFRTIPGLEFADPIITSVWTVVENLGNGTFSYALGELAKAGNESMEGQQTASDGNGATVAIDATAGTGFGAVDGVAYTGG